MIDKKIYEDLKSLSLDGVYNRPKIELWLKKCEPEYKVQSGFFEEFSKDFTYARSLTKYAFEFQFLDVYEVLVEVLECYSNELYYKEQIELYSTINEDKIQLDSWLQAHKLDEDKKQAKFKQLFQNNSTISGYEFVIRYPLSLPVTIKLDEVDFKETLQFLDILERSRKVQYIGIINKINDLEVFEKKVTITDEWERHRRAFTRRSMIITEDDTYGSELNVRFMDERTQLIEGLKVGQVVKLYADLTEKKNESDILSYPLSLLGWDIEIIKQVTNGDNRKNKSIK